MIKILVDGLPRTVGGIGTLLMNIVDKCREQGEDIEFEFLVPSGSRYLEILEKRNETFYQVPPVSKTSEYKNAITKLFEEHHYDFLWFNNTSKVNIYLPRIAKKVGLCKIITHVHGMGIEASGKWKLIYTTLDKLHANELYRLVDIPLACSKDAAKYYYRQKSVLDRSTVIYNGIETSKFTFDETARETVRSELGVSEDEILLGTTGRLTAIKNYPFIIEMLKDLPEKYKLIIAGIGGDEAMLNELIKSNGLQSRCRLLGLRTDIPQLLSAMDIFLLPSFSEGMPFALIEAQSSGLPCLISDTLSEELSITDLVSRASISNGSNVWATKIPQMNIGKASRMEYSSKVRSAGYDIDIACKQFAKILNKAIN